MSHRRAAVTVEDVSYLYQPQGVQALTGVDLRIGEGEFVGIIGQNGAGKSTLLKLLVGLLTPTTGRVLVDGRDTRGTAVADLATVIGLVLQNPDRQLFSQTVEDEIAFGPRNLGLEAEAIRNRVEGAIAMTDLDPFRNTFPPALAKGDRAKVIIASVLAMRPKIVAFDEPTTGQDYRGCHQIMGIAQDLHRDGHTVIVVTHDVGLIAEYTERAVVLCQGEILLDDATELVFAQPDVLRRTNVTPPQITQLASSLPRRLGLPSRVLTVEQLGEAIVEQSRPRLADGQAVRGDSV